MGPRLRGDDTFARVTTVANSTLKSITGTILLAGAGKMGGAMLTGWLSGGLDPRRVHEARRDDLECFIELHIEQGPLLEHAGLPVSPAALGRGPEPLPSTLRPADALVLRFRERAEGPNAPKPTEPLEKAG